MPATPNPDSRFQALVEAAGRQMEALRIPGLALGVSASGQEWTAGLGVTSLEHPLPVTPETLFQVGSITKTVLATAALRLQAQGRLDLDAPVRTYLPRLRLADETVARQVTLRHLLTHTGGWVGDYFNDFGPGADALALMVAQLARLPQLTPLGEIYSYNNSGFYLAGRVIEVLTGQSFEAAIAELVLRPLGMTHSFFFTDDIITHRAAVGHELVEDTVRVARPWAIGRASFPAGGLVSTVPDLLRFARFHLGDGQGPEGETLLPPGALPAMHTPLFPSTGLNWIGLAWRITPLAGVNLVSHGGATNGQESVLLLAPGRDFAIAVLTNSDRGDAACVQLYTQAVEDFLGLAWPQTPPLPLPAASLQPFVGRYDSAMAEMAVALVENELVLQIQPKGHFPTPDSPPAPAPPPVRLGVYAEDRVIALDPPYINQRGEFLRDPEGKITWFRFGGRVNRRLP